MTVKYENAQEIWEQIKNIVPTETKEAFEKLLSSAIWSQYGHDEDITVLIETLIHEINENLELNNISLEEKKSKTKKVSGREFVITKTANRIKSGKARKKQIITEAEDESIKRFKTIKVAGKEIKLTRSANRLKNVKVTAHTKAVDYTLTNIYLNTYNKIGYSEVVQYNLDFDQNENRKKYNLKRHYDEVHISRELHFDNPNFILNSWDSDYSPYINKKCSGGNIYFEDKELEELLKRNGIPTEDQKIVSFIYNETQFKFNQKIEECKKYQYLPFRSTHVNCIAVFCKGDLIMVIDPQGYSYARYMYLPTIHTKKNTTKTLDWWMKNFEEYKEKMIVDDFTGKKTEANYPIEDIVMLDKNGNYINKKAKTIKVGSKEITIKKTGNRVSKFSQKVKKIKFKVGDFITKINPNKEDNYFYEIYHINSYSEIDKHGGTTNSDVQYYICDTYDRETGGKVERLSTKFIPTIAQNKYKLYKPTTKTSNEPKVIDFKPGVKKAEAKKTTQKAKTPKAPKVAKPTYKRAAPYWYKILQKFKNMAGKENKTTSSIQDFLLFLQGSCNAKLNKTTPYIEIIRKIQDVIYPYANNLDKTHQDLPKWESLVNECKAAMATIKISKKSGEDPIFETVTLSGYKSKSKKSKKCK